MNCKPGDLAVIVNSASGNEGKFVTCVTYLGKREQYAEEWKIEEVDMWLVDRDLDGLDGVPNRTIADYQLRPIRPHGDDETDERLLKTGMPERNGVAA